MPQLLVLKKMKLNLIFIVIVFAVSFFFLLENINDYLMIRKTAKIRINDFLQQESVKIKNPAIDEKISSGGLEKAWGIKKIKEYKTIC